MPCFSCEQGNQIKSFVFRNANPSNLRGSLLEGNKDHLLNQARCELMKQELQVGALNNCIGSFRNKLMLKDWHYRTHKTDLLNPDENKFDHKKNCL